MGIKDDNLNSTASNHKSTFDTAKNLNSLGRASSPQMRIIAVKNAQYYEDPVAFLLNLLEDETTEQVLQKIEGELLKQINDVEAKEVVHNHLTKLSLSDSANVNQLKCYQRLLARLY
jgi:hypothetical protein